MLPDSETPADSADATDAGTVRPEADPRDSRIAELEAKLRDVEGRLRAVSRAYTEQKAEMASFRERQEAQARAQLERREFDLVALFLDPVQDLTRSLEAGAGDAESLVAGVRMVRNRFLDGLEKLGLREVSGVGSRFDPTVHDAISTEIVADASEDGVILAVAEAGYVHGSRTLRAARVVVGKFVGAAEA